MAKTEQEIDVTKIVPQRKHATIFETYDALEAGETFVIINDHDPKPLKYQMAAERGEEKFSWNYLQEGPDSWKVRIGKTN